MAAPEGSVSIVSHSMSGSNTQFGSTLGDAYPRYVICIDYGTTYTGKDLGFLPNYQLGDSTDVLQIPQERPGS